MLVNSMNLGANIKSNPAVFNYILVVASRDRTINDVKIKK